MELTMTFAEKLIKLRAYREFREWVGDKTLTESWQTCENVDWMLWLAEKAGVDKRKIALCAARFAETVLDKMTDECSRNAVRVALRYGNGEQVSQEELETARIEASYAAYAAYAAFSAYAAAYAGSAAAFSAYVVAYAAAAYAYEASYAAKAGSEANMANIVREVIKIEDLKWN